jgi:hypothetical protein
MELVKHGTSPLQLEYNVRLGYVIFKEGFWHVYYGRYAIASEIVFDGSADRFDPNYESLIRSIKGIEEYS